MLRFILKRRLVNNINGQDCLYHETIDIDMPELEDMLTRGGSGPDGCDYTTLDGVEVIAADEEQN